MTWTHWVLFVILSLLAVAMTTDKNAKTSTRLTGFVLFVGMVLLLVLGQPK